jgi:hypothetical protein
VAGWLVGTVVVLALFPPFHIRPLSAVGVAQKASAGVNVPGFAERFWDEKLVSPAVPGSEAAAVVAALVQDPALAAGKYGRRAGVGGKTFFLVSGAGRVASIDQTGVWIDVGGAQTPRVLLLTGPVFGNALRDVTGLLNLSDDSSADSNSLSRQLNHLSETRAQAALQGARVGASIAFRAAGEIDDASQAVPVLRLAPIRVEVRP